MYIPNTFWTWAFFGVAMLQAITALGLESYVFGEYQLALQQTTRSHADPNNIDYTRSIPTYLSLLIFAFIYQLILVYDALANKNTIQVIGLCFYNLGILVYTAIQKDQIHDASNSLDQYPLKAGKTSNGKIGTLYWNRISPTLTAIPCIVTVATLALSFVAWKLYDEFAWTIYKQISADLRLKRRYLIYQIYIALLKFDFFLFLGFEVQFLVIVSNTSNVEEYLTIASVPITILILLLAAYCTQRENMPGMVLTIIVYVGGLAYFLFKVIRMYDGTARANDYKPARRTLTVFAIITIILDVLTIVVACWCTSNFNKGLKPHVVRSRKSTPRPTSDGKGQYYMDSMGGHRMDYQVGSRMEID